MYLYREEILEHWQDPLNYGVINHADLVVNQVNPLCGDEITFYFKISHNAHPRGAQGGSQAHPWGVIREVKFTSSGCAISTASASILSEAIKGKKVNNISQMQGKDVLKLIGGGANFPPARLKCAFLALEAIKKIRIMKRSFASQN